MSSEAKKALSSLLIVGEEMSPSEVSTLEGTVQVKGLAGFVRTKQVFVEKVFDTVAVYLGKSEQLDQPTLIALVKVLKPEGRLQVVGKTKFDQSVQKAIKIAGLTDFQSTDELSYSAVRKVYKVQTVAVEQASKVEGTQDSTERN